MCAATTHHAMPSIIARCLLTAHPSSTPEAVRTNYVGDMTMQYRASTRAATERLIFEAPSPGRLTPTCPSASPQSRRPDSNRDPFITSGLARGRSGPLEPTLSGLARPGEAIAAEVGTNFGTDFPQRAPVNIAERRMTRGGCRSPRAPADRSSGARSRARGLNVARAITRLRAWRRITRRSRAAGSIVIRTRPGCEKSTLARAWYGHFEDCSTGLSGS